METFNFNNYIFVCEYWETSRAWGHKVTLMHPSGVELARYKVRYYNRTWEMYTYQSAMYGALDGWHKNELDRYLNIQKSNLNIKRWGKGQKQEYIDKFESERPEFEMLRERIHNGK